MSSIRVTTNFRDNFGTDLGDKLITKDYLMSVYPSIAQELGKTPELWAWGSNGAGQGTLGINSTISFNAITPITTFAGGTNWKQVAGGNNCIAAIKTDGTLWLWGQGSSGELGNNAAANRITPVTTFAGGTNWKQVACGNTHTAAIKTDGTLWLWGINLQGQLGDNTTITKSTPVTTFAGGTNWKQVSGGNSHTAAVKTDGTLWTWGLCNSSNKSGIVLIGALGINNTTLLNISTPVTTFAGGTNWKQVSCGQFYAAAIKTDGTLWTWGQGGSGQLGNNAAANRITPVTTFAGGTNWKQVSAFPFGSASTSAIKTDGTLWSWGFSLSLGDNTLVGKVTPVTTFAGGTNWKQVYSLGTRVSAIKTDGTLWVWGQNPSGQLGDNTTTQRCTPVTTFAGGTNWRQVGGVSDTSAAIRTSDGI
jgi:alpha-tubulin suppressor-like RCC1 family protein